MRADATYEELRRLLFSIAYRMIGSVSEAEDIVQEAFLRSHRAESTGTRIESPKAYLSAVTTRLGIDHLKSARVKREQYVGKVISGSGFQIVDNCWKLISRGLKSLTDSKEKAAMESRNHGQRKRAGAKASHKTPWRKMPVGKAVSR